MNELQAGSQSGRVKEKVNWKHLNNLYSAGRERITEGVAGLLASWAETWLGLYEIPKDEELINRKHVLQEVEKLDR